jgi:hypothetical protein
MNARRRLRIVPALVGVALSLLLTACGGEDGTWNAGEARGCVIVDVSNSARDELTRTYEPDFAEFVQRLARKGSGQVCFALAGRQVAGGTSAWATFTPQHPQDALRAPLEVRQQVQAAVDQLDAAAESPTISRHGSALLEALYQVSTAPLRSGDEVLMLSDGVQFTDLVGSFGARATDMSPAGIDAMLDRLSRADLLPDLQGVTVRIPHLLYSDPPLNMGPARQAAVRRFWGAYGERTGARMILSAVPKAS